jgi:inhibitor of KinA
MTKPKPYTKIYPAGDQGFFIRFGDAISPEIHQRILAGLKQLDQNRPHWITDAIPSYRSILVLYDCLAIEAENVRDWIGVTLAQVTPETVCHRVVEIPVWYDPQVGPDLEDLARSKDLSVQQLIELHTAPEYLTYMLGFKPGFPFLGGLDERLWAPRLPTPRLEVAAGSIGIGGKQTGIYPVKSPGGWRILGRTPLRIFNPFVEKDQRTPLRPENSFRILPGDKVKFFAVDRSQYDELINAEK